MKKYFIFILFFVVLLSGCIKNNITTENNNTDEKLKLPENFTLILTYDGTSSGSSRFYRYQISFEGEKVVSINRSSFSAPCTGGVHYCEEKLDLQTGKWINTRWEGYSNLEPEHCANIGSYFNSHSTREDVIQAIQSGKFTPKEKGCHYRICYEIIEN